ncbi:MAG: IS21 family transposase [Novosphingobium sp.]|nr:IS21 family transposase [Novosphingobium sp.]
MLRQLLTSELSCNAIARQRGMSHRTVRRWKAIAVEQSLTVQRLDQTSDAELAATFRAKGVEASHFVLPVWEDEIALIGRGYSRFDAHAQYAERVGARAIAYRTYCLKLSEHQKVLNPILRIEHVAGYAMQTDYAGYVVPGMENGSTHPTRFKLFVAVLPYSRLIAASLVRSENVADHIEGNRRALEYFGGAPKVLVPDNLKAAVISRPMYGAPRLQEVYQAFADHYEMGVMPARPRTPQDKSAVENSVKLIQRSLRPFVNSRPLMDLATLQARLADIAEYWNNRPLKRANGQSRRSLFEASERSQLQPLPPTRFEVFELSKPRTVQKDYHVEYATNFYSVPHRLIGQRAIICASAHLIDIRVDGLSVATHARLHGRHQRATLDVHRPSNHRAEVEGSLSKWAERFCPDVRTIAAAEMLACQTPLVRAQRLRWIKDLSRFHTRKRFEAACRRAVSLGDLRFEHVENVLKRGIEAGDQHTEVQQKLKPQRNVRGPGYFREGGSANV